MQKQGLGTRRMLARALNTEGEASVVKLGNISKVVDVQLLA